MTHIIANPVSAGLAVTIDDPDAERIIAARVPIVLRHLTTWRERDNQPALSAAEQRNPGLLLPWFQELERRVQRVDAGDAVAIQQGLATWRDAYTIPLAADLGLIQIAADLVLHHCYRRGSFDRLTATGRRERPTETVTLPQVQQILATTEATSRRVAALVAQGLCRTADVATTAVEAVRRVHDRSADQARGIVLAYSTYGEIGLLVASAYPATAEVLLLLQHTAYVVAHSAAPAATVSQLIADLLALRAALQAADPALWQRRLLHEPAVSSYRQAYQRTLWTHRRTLILTALTEGGRYDAADATQLRDALLTGGLARLLDLRCQLVPGTTVERFERQRTQQAIATTFAVLSAADRTVLTHLLTHLQDAMEETGVGLPLAALIASYPSSWRRRQIGRRVWFGLGATMQRRQRQQRRRRPPALPPQRRATRAQPGEDPPMDTLVRAFAQRAGLDARDGRSRVRLLITYGPLGLLERARWATCLDARLQSWFALIKWGRLDGAVPWAQVLAQANWYLANLGLAGVLSAQLVMPLLSSIRKPRRWHGGTGEATAQVRQRATAVTTTMPRLHETWLLVPLELPLPLCDLTGATVAQVAHVLLVVDRGSALPMGLWVSATPPGPAEIGLSLYQAIWHPGNLDWPLRGIPEIIQLPTALGHAPLDDLYRAAPYLLATIDTSHRRPQQGYKPIIALQKRLEHDAPAIVAAALASHERTASRVLHALLQWLQTTYFPYHRAAPVWAAIRRHGVLMPGHDTPAAGWLLPQNRRVPTMTNAVLLDGRRYSSPWFRCQPDQELPARTFPIRYPAPGDHEPEDGMFVEVAHERGSQVYYLHAQR